jgi:hypothetical protein
MEARVEGSASSSQLQQFCNLLAGNSDQSYLITLKIIVKARCKLLIVNVKAL